MIKFNTIPIPISIKENKSPISAAPSQTSGGISLVNKNIAEYNIAANMKGLVKIIYLSFLFLNSFIKKITNNAVNTIPINITIAKTFDAT